ncbi:MAG: carbohydrate binding domain-containing protein [Eubacterium sp.]|nr:carbohydrate binding domain-containing protein [Eubacterium sp.]
MKRPLWKIIVPVLTAAMSVMPAVMPAYAAKSGISAAKCVLSKGDRVNLDIIGEKELTGTYASGKQQIASVTKNGLVTAKKTGSTVITWTKGGKKYTCAIQVVKAPKISKTEFTLKEGESEELSVKKSGNKELSVKWSSSDPSIVTVKDGKVTAVSEGKAKINVKIKGNTKTWKKEAQVTVKNSDGSGIYDGYQLVWQESFDGDTLNMEDWNIETHEPGWVNNELQQYTDSSENIFIRDGKLVIKPVETVGADGTVSYTSGRVNTQNKHNFKYGLFEARIKVPKGQGFLPAFWMMPANENLYGQWPRCGEIDIMEVLGSQTDTTYGTVHFGNPHSESQGKYTLETGNFSDEYHTFSAEWEPGMIRWYVDGSLIHTENDWYSATEGQGEITYPAPFDQPFYMILNLAVGGNWPGNPDASTNIKDAEFLIDDIKVYQKDSYNENVEKPVKNVVLREPGADGNYINNGDFSVHEALTDEQGWSFLNALEGEASASIKNKEICIKTTKEGTADYSVQLVQPDLPMKKGGVYRVSFDAYANEKRTMKVGISAPDRGYKRYLEDTLVELETEKKTFTYEFTMTENDDANGRLEFNMGAAGSTADIYISNVSIIKTEEKDLEKAAKTVRADGNYVYNGGFQEGAGRLGYWEIDRKDGASVSVTNEDNIRRLKVTADAATSTENPVIIVQNGLPLTEGNYVLSFLAEGESGASVKVKSCGKELEAELAGEAQTYRYQLVVPADGLAEQDKRIAFEITQPGTYYLDDVCIEEDSLIKNGSFRAGFSGYEVYAYTASDVSYVVDSLNEDNAADFSIQNTGDAAWKIQLKQNNIQLEKGQWYRLSLKAKSDKDRKIMFAIQRDGSSDDNWTPYSGEKKVVLGKEYQIYDIVFQMEHETDVNSVLSISMGAVDGEQIDQKHRICIDEISLEKTEKPAS